ncbi:hypothetical protein [Microbacterium gubbeenense]|uniref:hypothetical protein n=1 Tax=Microbacterium gubbeenense TaxID=159896 RepID=UPI0012FCC2FE|nr:hypothetical protein [Microbacterium gubbeenense]
MAKKEPLATPEQMCERTQGEVSAESHPFLANELASASDDIRTFCRWHIYPEKQVTYRRVGASADDVWLSAMEITSIDEVTVDGETWDDDRMAAVEFDPDTGWTNICGRKVHVKYTAGFDEVPPNLVTATLELAAQGLGTSLGQTREQAGSVSITYGRSGGGIDESSPGGQRLIAYRIGRLP